MKKIILYALYSLLMLLSIVMTYGITTTSIRRSNDIQDTYTQEAYKCDDLAMNHDSKVEYLDLLHMLSQGYLAETFFGEWTITELVSICRRMAVAHPVMEVRYQQLIGTTIYMSYEDILIDGEALSELPWYYIVIRSIDPIPHSQFLPSPAEIIRTPFVVFVGVELLGFINPEGRISGEFQFYIKDSDTIFLIYSSVFFRAERS